MTGTPWLDWLIYLGGGATALGALWRWVLRPVSIAINQVDEYGPVLRDMAKQFKSDSGSTLKDALNRLEAQNIEQARLGAINPAAIKEARRVAARAVAESKEDRRLLREVLGRIEQANGGKP